MLANFVKGTISAHVFMKRSKSCILLKKKLTEAQNALLYPKTIVNLNLLNVYGVDVGILYMIYKLAVNLSVAVPYKGLLKHEIQITRLQRNSW